MNGIGPLSLEFWTRMVKPSWARRVRRLGLVEVWSKRILRETSPRSGKQDSYTKVTLYKKVDSKAQKDFWVQLDWHLQDEDLPVNSTGRILVPVSLIRRGRQQLHGIHRRYKKGIPMRSEYGMSRVTVILRQIPDLTEIRLLAHFPVMASDFQDHFDLFDEILDVYNQEALKDVFG